MCWTANTCYEIQSGNSKKSVIENAILRFTDGNATVDERRVAKGGPGRDVHRLRVIS